MHILLSGFRGTGLSGFLVALVGLWIYYSLPTARLASNRGRNYLAWLLLSLAISPALAALALMISESAKSAK